MQLQTGRSGPLLREVGRLGAPGRGTSRAHASPVAIHSLPVRCQFVASSRCQHRCQFSHVAIRYSLCLVSVSIPSASYT